MPININAGSLGVEGGQVVGDVNRYLPELRKFWNSHPTSIDLAEIQDFCFREVDSDRG